MRAVIIAMICAASLPAGKMQECALISCQGNVEVRSAYQETWTPARPGQALEALATVRTGRASYAVLKTFDGTVFQMPAGSQIEIRELKKMTRDEIIMELTAYELQKLPGPKEREKPAQAFVLHGIVREPDDKEARDRYLMLEINGALALYGQGFIPGFILKWNRLHYQFPDVRMPEADALIEAAYKTMEMPGRLKSVMQP